MLGRSRRTPVEVPPVEVPRDVFADAAAEIARHFEATGWRYARSGPHLTRRAGRFTAKIALASSAYNRAGAHVDLHVATLVASRELKAWRAEQQAPLTPGDRVAAGPLGNLARERRWLSWNLADPATRAAAVTDVVERIERLALPWFDVFADDARLVERLRTERMPNMWAGDAVEVLVWLGEREAAEQHARLWLADPHVAERFDQETRRLETDPRRATFPTDPGTQLACVASAHGLRP